MKASWLRRAWGRVERDARRVRAAALPLRARLVYHHTYQVPDNGFVDPHRAERIVDYLRASGCVGRRHLAAAPPVDIADLARCHDYAYLGRIDQPDTLAHVFAGALPPEHADALVRAQRRMCGGTLWAAREALRAPGVAQINLGGGLHHAYRDHGEGFCLLNDVAVAIMALRARGFGGRILVVDLDLHQGNGTRRIFAEDDSVYTLSIHASDWDPEPAGEADRNVALGNGVGDRHYAASLQAHLPEVFARHDPELVFYVAGTDIALDDTLGSWRVSAEGVLERDRLVLELVGERSLVWVLAGGYGTNAWRHTARSLSVLLGGPGDPIPTDFEVTLEHFRRIARRMSDDAGNGKARPVGLEGPLDLELDEAELFGRLAGRHQKPRRLLGYYSAAGVEIALERFGILAALRGRGYERLRIALDLDGENGEMVRVFSDDERQDLLIELVVRPEEAFAPYRLLSIEWLLMQDPRAVPDPERGLLPGQRYPGLGCFGCMVSAIPMACETLGFDGLVFRPSHYHVAAQAKGLLAFLEPEDEARFLAFEAVLRAVPLGEASQLVAECGVVHRGSGACEGWAAAPMVLPLARVLEERLASEAFQRDVEAASARFDLILKR